MKVSIFFVLILFPAFFLVEVSARKNFVLLVAGSKGYDNYRHQADVCHAYQIFHKNGIPDEQIVVMMYDDIANNTNNPYKGQIFNKPNGPDVYQGVPKDYTGKDVNADVFFAVLEGNKEQVKAMTGRDGKVIESGPEDDVFLYYVDHGTSGYIGMPAGRLIYYDELIQELEYTHKHNKFGNLTFYMEACQSGSMFRYQLPKDINVYAVSSANLSESSYGCYCEDLKMGTCLGDTFSVSWMEDIDASDVYTETFETQFHRVYNRTTGGNKKGEKSHPHQFGDFKLTSRKLSAFMAKSNGSDTFSYRKEPISQEPFDAIPSELVSLVMLQRRIARLPEGSPLIPDLEKRLKEMELMREHTFNLFSKIVETVLGVSTGSEYYKQIFYEYQDIDNSDCYKTAVDLLMESCPKVDTNINTFFLRHLHVLVNLCNHQPTDKVMFAVRSASRGSRLCH